MSYNRQTPALSVVVSEKYAELPTVVAYDVVDVTPYDVHTHRARGFSW